MADIPLEDKTIEDVTSEDVDALIGRNENQRLDFKETIEQGSDANRELARDLCSFANAVVQEKINIA